MSDSVLRNAWSIFHDFNYGFLHIQMDADFVDTRSSKKKSKLLGKLKKNSKFAEALQKKKPVFDPS